jgi:predicted helicase
VCSSDLSQSSTSILNYAYWLIHQNQVNANVSSDNIIFEPRSFVICDEAHRTVGVTRQGQEDSNFTAVHNNDYIKSKKRLYNK